MTFEKTFDNIFYSRLNTTSNNNQVFKYLSIRVFMVIVIELQLNLDIRSLKIASRMNLELGPWFAEVWGSLNSQRTWLQILVGNVEKCRKAQNSLFATKEGQNVCTHWSNTCYAVILFFVKKINSSIFEHTNIILKLQINCQF